MRDGGLGRAASWWDFAWPFGYLSLTVQGYFGEEKFWRNCACTAWGYFRVVRFWVKVVSEFWSGRLDGLELSSGHFSEERRKIVS